MNDRSSARHTQAAKTAQPVVRKIVHLRWKQRLGPVPIGAQLGVPASTVHAVLVRCRLSRLSHTDRVTGEPARRYERSRPGELIHVDVTKFGNIPDGGGWRFTGRTRGDHNRQATRDRTGIKARSYYPKVGTCFVHTVIDDYSRVAYAECHDDEKAITAAAVLGRAVTWFAERGVTVERVLSDNGPACKSFLWRDACGELGITMKKTKPRRPFPELILTAERRWCRLRALRRGIRGKPLFSAATSHVATEAGSASTDAGQGPGVLPAIVIRYRPASAAARGSGAHRPASPHTGALGSVSS